MKFLADGTLERLRRICDEPDLTATPYRLEREIARGGMGTVYEVEDLRLERRVALKVLHPAHGDADAAVRMVREAQVVARLEHPGIVPIHDVGTLGDGRVYYTMKLVEGTRLDRVPAEGRPWPELLRMFEKACEAVAFAHSFGVVHRDLKPQNIMVGSFGEVLVMDWGLAKLLRAGEVAAIEAGSPDVGEAGFRFVAPPAAGTAYGTVMGTPGYMAPEQARGQVDQVDERADVYALGVILRFLLAAGAELGPDDETLPRDASDSEEMPRPPESQLRAGVPKSVRAIIDKATARDPAARYADAAQLAEEVRRLLDGLPVSAYRESWLERARRFYARYRTLILLILTYVVIRALMLAFLER